MSRVVVFGANGRTGRVIVEEALRAGYGVTAAVRTPEKFSPVTVDGPGALAVVRADVRDPASVRAAIAGHDAVISAIGPPGRLARGLYSDGARALVRAMEHTGPRAGWRDPSTGMEGDPHGSRPVPSFRVPGVVMSGVLPGRASPAQMLMLWGIFVGSR